MRSNVLKGHHQSMLTVIGIKKEGNYENYDFQISHKTLFELGILKVAPLGIITLTMVIFEIKYQKCKFLFV